MKQEMVTVTRNVSKDDPTNFAGRDVEIGEKLYVFRDNTYNLIGPFGIALSERGSDVYPFFEFPLDATDYA